MRLRRATSSLVWMLAICWAVVGRVAAASEPPGYYDSARGKAGQPLRVALHVLTRSGQAVLPYDSAANTDTADALKVLDEDPTATNSVILLYASRSEAKTNYPVLWNREHMWPESYGTGAGAAHSDLFNLRPEDSRINSARGNKYYDESDPADRLYKSPAHVDAPLCSTDSDSWEPPPGVEGDIARAMFYMDVRYEGEDGEPDLALTEDIAQIASGKLLMGKLSSLLRWHRDDPVDAGEQTRNDLVFARYQRNRNPFVDHPEWVEAVFLPRIVVSRAGETLTIAWDSQWTNVVLEATELALVPPGPQVFGWAAVTNRAEVAASIYTVTVPVTGAARIYRLRLQ